MRRRQTKNPADAGFLGVVQELLIDNHKFRIVNAEV